MYFSLNSICLRKGHLSHLFLINWSFVTLLKIGISHTPQILPWYIVLGCKTFWCTVQKRGNVVKTNILLSLEWLDCKVGPWLSCENWMIKSPFLWYKTFPKWQKWLTMPFLFGLCLIPAFHLGVWNFWNCGQLHRNYKWQPPLNLA